MKYVFFILMFFALEAKEEKKVCDSQCQTQANEFTKKLNSEPLKNYVPQPAAPTNVSGPSQNNLKVLALLENLQKTLTEKKDTELPEFQPNRPLRPSDKDDTIPAMRQILQSLGYLEKAGDSPFFDMELENAVKAFQVGHCLEADGIIGDETKAKLNWSYARRLELVNDSIAKIKNLTLTERTVIVNIPTYMLYAYNDQQIKMHSKIIIGQSKRPTPLMTSYINAVEYNPAWVVPNTILFEDKLPKVQEDPEFFEKNDMEVFDNDGNEVDPSTVEWNEVQVHDFPYVFKQKPSAKNALGLIKFNLQNNDLIYMHDTPQRELFKQNSRALSSGCIRLEKPGKFACWLLNVDKDEVKASIDTAETHSQSLEKPVTVYIIYAPVWIDEKHESNKVLWGDDPYKLDPKPFH